jgi:hypothetical protein
VEPFGGEPMKSLAAVEGISISIAMAPLRPCALRQGDHVVALDETPHHAAGVEYEIERAAEDHSGRGTIHILRR